MRGTDEALTPAKRRLLDLLKVKGSSTAAELAEQLELTDVAVRQHLQALAATGLVASRRRPAEGRGRPSSSWRLTDLAQSLFPDRHGELTVGLLAAIRETFGQDGVDRVIASRAREQARDYRRSLPGSTAPLGERARALAERRTREGYMAEVQKHEDGYLLVEHHCPVCEAAESCTGLCSAELDVFRAALGKDARVERVAHLLSGDERCVYSIRPRASAAD